MWIIIVAFSMDSLHLWISMDMLVIRSSGLQVSICSIGMITLVTVIKFYAGNSSAVTM